MKAKKVGETELIIRKLSGELSDVEDEQFRSWLAKKTERLALFHELEHIYLCSKHLKTDFEPDVEQALRRVKRRRYHLLFSWKMVSRYAAVFLLLIGIASCYFFLFPQETKQIAGTEVCPGHACAILHLASGEKIDLNNQDNGICLRNREGSHILIDSNRVLRYRATDKNVAKERMNALEVPVGGEYRLILSDGTQVWLNSSSVLTYPEIFAGNTRRVELKGEAFFQVMPDSKKPFVVVAKGIDIKVLGTTFNVKAYEEEKFLYTTLVEGKVELLGGAFLQSVVLLPGEQAIADDLGVQKRGVNTDLYTSWMEGKFLFIDTPLEEICRQIARWYDVKVVFTDDSIRKICFTGGMMKFRPLEELLGMIGATSPVCFNIQDNVLILSLKK